jgi:hypothetical protein
MHLDPTGLVIGPYRGGLALTGAAVDAAAAAYDFCAQAPAHITLLTATEVRATTTLAITNLADIPLDHIYVLGIGSSRSVRWAVVVWNHGDTFRRALGLGRKAYHITLGDADDHTLDKGIGSVHAPAEEIVDTAAEMGESALDHVFVSAPQGLVSPASAAATADGSNACSPSAQSQTIQIVTRATHASPRSQTPRRRVSHQRPLHASTPR